MAPYQNQVITKNGKIYTGTIINEEMDIKEITEEELKCDYWEILKYTIEAKVATKMLYRRTSFLKTIYDGICVILQAMRRGSLGTVSVLI